MPWCLILYFDYTIEPGQETTSDLAYTILKFHSVLDGGTIKDTEGNDAILTLPFTWSSWVIIAQIKTIVVDTTCTGYSALGITH